jgi:hypothetical protein
VGELALCPECFIRRKGPLMANRMKCWLDLRASLDAVVKRKTPASAGISAKLSCLVNFCTFSKCNKRLHLLKVQFHFLKLYFNGESTNFVSISKIIFFSDLKSKRS